MPSLDSINDLVNRAIRTLDQAASEISELPLDPPVEHIRSIGSAVANLVQIQRTIYELRPDLAPKDVPRPDPDITEEEKALVAKLSSEELEEIDGMLLSNTRAEWRKVAMIVSLAIETLKNRIKGIPDIFYAQRIRKLVEEGRLESQGNLQYMRFSEVRRPSAKGERNIDR